MVKLVCMTLPYAAHPFERALEGIAKAGYQYVAFGLEHAGQAVPDEEGEQAAEELERLMTKYGLKPVMIIGNRQLAPGQPVERIRKRMQLAQQLGVGEILSVGTFGYRSFPHEPIPGDEMEKLNDAFIDQFQKVAAEAEAYGRMVTLKPHTGNTATSVQLKETLDRIGSPAVQVSYDPGNVQFYEGIDAVEDFKLIAERTHSLIAKDHRGQRAELQFPVPGSGDVDFLRLFQIAKEAGFKGNVVVERIDGPSDAEAIDLIISEARTALLHLLEEAGLEI